LNAHVEQSQKFASKHNVIADAITEQFYVNDSLKVYGVLYDYVGMSATATQFYLTDSMNHFFRGALYFNTEINDSILPINNFLKYDIKHLIETFHWKDK
jgi:gliding motility-associated lipoprotein GldD